MTDARASLYGAHAAAVAVLALGFLDCGADVSGAASEGGIGDDSAFGGSVGTGGTSPGIAGTASGGTAMGGTSSDMDGGPLPPEPEIEIETAFDAPVATNRYVWTANPESGRVAFIDAETSAVRLAEAGFRPSTVVALPSRDDEDSALVLNEGSADATLFRVSGDALSRVMLDTHAGANAVAVAPSGRFALVWTDAARFEDEIDPTDGLQDVTVLDLGDELRATRLAVGYRPSRVVFDAEESRVLVVTQPGLSVIELGDDPRVAALVELTDNPASDSAARDVSVTPDGEVALVRLDGSMELVAVEVRSGRRRAIGLDGFVTDLDLSHDGERAFAMVGTSNVSSLVVLPLATLDDPGSFEHVAIPNVTPRSVSLSADDRLALLYTNSEENPYLTVLTSDGAWSDADGWSLDLKAPVLAVFAAPNGLHGIAFQATLPDSERRGAFSLISAQADRAPKIIGTDAAPVSVAYSADGEHAVIATRDLRLAKYGAYLVHLEHLDETLISLASPPLGAGIVARAGKAYVAQAHPEGRVTFIDLEDGGFTTLTGFELAGRVYE